MSTFCKNLLIIIVFLTASLQAMVEIKETQQVKPIQQEGFVQLVQEEPGLGKHLQGFYYDKTSLQELAEEKGVGYKTGNLMMLEKLIKHDKQLSNLTGGYRVEVPEFVGVPSNTVKSFLQNSGLDFDKRWQELIEKYVSSDDIKNGTLPEAFVKGLGELREDIKKVFDDEAGKLGTGYFSYFSGGKDLSSLGFEKELVTLINKVAEEKGFITTRSTGTREDTDAIANAGGNESVEIVEANQAPVLKEMRKVITSYIDLKSLAQRAEAGDKKLFDTPALPVLVQKVVGEKDDSLVTSCVSYTQEARGDTKDISSTVCAWGHGKVVVDSLLPTDKFFCDKEGICHVGVTTKISRLKPVNVEGKFKLKEVENPEGIQTKSSLSTDEQKAVTTLLNSIEEYYQMPMDVEFVIDPGSKTGMTNRVIYLVQARPIVYKKSDLKPSYLASLEPFKKLESLSVTKINDAGGALRLVFDERQMLVAKNLDQALELVMKGKTDKNKVEVIVVEEEGDPESHAGATLRGMNKVLLQTPDAEKLKEWDKQKKLVDVQRGVIIALDATEFNQDMVKEGLFSHPIPPKYSIPEKMLSSEKINELINKYADVKDSFKNKSLEELVELVKEAKPEVAEQAFDCILHRIAQQIKHLKSELTSDNPYIAFVDKDDKEMVSVKNYLDSEVANAPSVEKAVNKLTGLFGYALKTSEQVKKELEKNTESRSLKRLYETNPLTALLFQESPKVVHGYSVQTVQKELSEEKRFMEKYILPRVEKKELPESLLKNPMRVAFVKFGVDRALSSKVEDSWINFVAKVKEIKQLKQMVDQFNKLGMVPAWLNAIFAPAYEKDKENCYKVLAEVYEKSSDFIQAATSKQQFIDSVDLSKFADPEAFEKQLKVFEKNLLVFFKTELFINQMTKDSSPLSNLVGSSLLGNVVEKFDKAIKTLKASTLMDDNTKVVNFKTMLEKYFDLFECATKIVAEGDLALNRDWSINRYASKLKEILGNRKLGTTQLNPSRGFSVAAAVLGSATEFSRHFPETLEDVFTTTHQSLLAISSAKTRRLTQDLVLLLPEQFQEVYKKLMALKISVQSRGVTEEVSLQTTGSVVTKETVTIQLNLPLRNHSARFALAYNKHDGTAVFSGKFLGQARNRWAQIYDTLLFASAAYDYVINKIDVQPLEMEFELSVNEKSNEKALDSMVTLVVDIANNQPFTDNLVNQLIDQKIITQKTFDAVVLKENFPFLPDELLKAILTKSEFASQIKPDDFELLLEKAKQTNNRAMFSFLVAKDQGFKEAAEAASKGITDQDRDVRNSALELFKELFAKDQGFKEAIEAASKGIADQDRDVRKSALLLFKELVAKDQGFKEAAEAASKGFADQDGGMRAFALRLFKELVAKNQGFKEAADAASEGITDQNVSLRDSALGLFKELVAKDQGFKEAAEAASKGFADQYYFVRASALLLFKELFAKDQGFKEAAEAASKGITDQNVSLRDSALELFKELVAKNQGFKEAADAASKGFADQESHVRDSALELFKELVAKNQGFKEAADAASEGITDQNVSLRDSALGLFKELVAKDQGFKEATEAASKGFADQYYFVRASALLLFKELVAKNQGFKEAADVASEGIADQESHVRDSALELFKELVAKGQGFKEATEAASKGIADQYYFVRASALLLFKELVAKNQGFKEAADVASEGIADQESHVRASALGLFKELVAKDQGFKEATEAASKGIADQYYFVRASALLLFKELVEKGQGDEVVKAYKELSNKNIVNEEMTELKKMLEQGTWHRGWLGL